MGTVKLNVAALSQKSANGHLIYLLPSSRLKGTAGMTKYFSSSMLSVFNGKLSCILTGIILAFPEVWSKLPVIIN